jgi:hypothetical protein
MPAGSLRHLPQAKLALSANTGLAKTQRFFHQSSRSNLAESASIILTTYTTHSSISEFASASEFVRSPQGKIVFGSPPGVRSTEEPKESDRWPVSC